MQMSLKPFTNFRADCHAMDSLDLTVELLRRISHAISFLQSKGLVERNGFGSQ